MRLRLGAGVHAGPFWVSASTTTHRRRNSHSHHVLAVFWSWLVLTAVVMTVIHTSWAAYLVAGLLVGVASLAGGSRHSRPPGRHR